MADAADYRQLRRKIEGWETQDAASRMRLDGPAGFLFAAHLVREESTDTASRSDIEIFVDSDAPIGVFAHLASALLNLAVRGYREDGQPEVADMLQAALDAFEAGPGEVTPLTGDTCDA